MSMIISRERTTSDVLRSALTISAVQQDVLAKLSPVEIHIRQSVGETSVELVNCASANNRRGSFSEFDSPG